jgi:hypothetical protein
MRLPRASEKRLMPLRCVGRCGSLIDILCVWGAYAHAIEVCEGCGCTQCFYLSATCAPELGNTLLFRPLFRAPSSHQVAHDLGWEYQCSIAMAGLMSQKHHGAMWSRASAASRQCRCLVLLRRRNLGPNLVKDPMFQAAGNSAQHTLRVQQAVHAKCLMIALPALTNVLGCV